MCKNLLWLDGCERYYKQMDLNQICNLIKILLFRRALGSQFDLNLTSQLLWAVYFSQCMSCMIDMTETDLNIVKTLLLSLKLSSDIIGKHAKKVKKTTWTHCGLVTPCSGIDRGQCWFRLCLVARRHQANTWSSVDLPSKVFWGIHLSAMSQEVLMNSIMCLEITALTSLSLVLHICINELCHHLSMR